MVQKEGDPVSRVEEAMGRLGAGKFFNCPQCGSRFIAREPVHDVLVMYDGEISSREEDLLDPFCSLACARTYCDEQRQRCSPRYDFVNVGGGIRRKR